MSDISVDLWAYISDIKCSYINMPLFDTKYVCIDQP